jgi:hypothetical protein
MSNATIDFTRSDLDAAVADALSKVTDERWTKAIYRAAANLAAGMFAFDGQHVIIRSASSSKRYRISTREPMQCSCRAHERGLRCWHIVAARLLVRAAERHARRGIVDDIHISSPMSTTPFASLTAITNAELF